MSEAEQQVLKEIREAVLLDGSQGIAKVPDGRALVLLYDAVWLKDKFTWLLDTVGRWQTMLEENQIIEPSDCGGSRGLPTKVKKDEI